MPVNDGWKEQLGFTSGTVLLWAFLLTRLLPLAAAMQLPNGLQPIDEKGRAVTELPIFGVLTLFGALGITGLVLGVVHICARGQWLALTARDGKTQSADNSSLQVGVSVHPGEEPTATPSDEPGRTKEKKIDSLCQKTFGLVFSTAKWAIALLSLYPFVFAVSGLQLGLCRLFSVKSPLVGGALYNVSLLVVIALTAIILRWRAPALWERITEIWNALGRLFESRDPFASLLSLIKGTFGPITIRSIWHFLTGVLSRPWFPVALLFVIALDASTYLAYKAELSIPKATYEKTTSGADVYVQLGGMTSNFNKMSLSLVDTNGRRVHTFTPLEVFNLGEGTYVARIELSGLSPGRYGVILEYPYIDVSLVPFYVHYPMKREKWFVVANK